jgi:ABC-type transporter Mla MlaB component
MTVTVECTVDDDACGLRVELTGHLGSDDVAALSLRLMQCLAEQPAALLVDLSGMRADEASVLALFLTVAEQARRWPNIPVLLCAPPSATRDLLDGVPHPVPLFGSAAAARDHAAANREDCPVLSEELLPVGGAPRYARNLATEVCLRWDLPHLVGPASLIVTELVSNVIDHAGTMSTLQFTLRPDHLTICVRDGSAAEPVASGQTSPAAPRGRGLLIVEAVAQEWGWLPTDGGKVVWATLAR